jgi:hypothetical protein
VKYIPTEAELDDWEIPAWIRMLDPDPSGEVILGSLKVVRTADGLTPFGYKWFMRGSPHHPRITRMHAAYRRRWRR